MPRVNAGGINLYYERSGEGIPFILHGHNHMWYMPFQVPYFSRFYDVIVHDRRGTGRSDDPPGPWTAADLALDIKNLMDALDIPKAIVGGISLGGVVSSQFGLDYPDRAHALLVTGTIPRLWPLGAQWIQDQIAMTERDEPPIVMQPRSYDWEEQGPPTTAPEFVASPMGRYVATLDNSMGNKDAIIKMVNVLAVWDQRPRYLALQQLDVPTLVMVGGNEPQKTIELSYEWHLQFKTSDYVILPNTHHNAGIENPIGWNKAVHAFLQRHGF